MKTLVLLLLFALLALGIYAYLNPDLVRQAEQAGRQLTGSAPRTATLYKWQDPDGQWQITDRPPAAGTPFETLEYRSDQNVLPLPPQLQEK